MPVNTDIFVMNRQGIIEDILLIFDYELELFLFL